MSFLDPRVWVAMLLVATMVAGGSGLYGYHKGKSAENASWSAKWELRNNADLTASLARDQQIKKIEQARQSDLAALDSHYQEIIANDQAAHDRDIASLRSGTLKLRQRFTCHSSAYIGLPKISSPTGLGDGEAPAGLREQDAEFLIGLADSADQVAKQLNNCQAVIRSYLAVR